jgi:hypothetical protein
MQAHIAVEAIAGVTPNESKLEGLHVWFWWPGSSRSFPNREILACMLNSNATLEKFSLCSEKTLLQFA